ncbi:MAG: hypothetical protein L6Q83_07850, partial [Gammaproteobacteria bacterium]|nr:hypothetical protein [Gammaproteobacteria bacterium]
RESLALLGEAVLLERNVYDRASTRLAAIQSGPPMYPESLQDYAYEWDRVGNLLARRSAGNGAPIEERFAYDELNRLKQATLDGVQTLSMIYTKDGNIRSRSDVGNFAYGYYGVHPHGVSAIGGGARGIMTFGYDDNGNMTNRNGTALTWTSYNLPRQIGSDTNYVRFSYGPRRTRTRQEVRSATGSKTVHHVGPHFEVEIEGPVRRFRSNLFANGRAVYSQVETSSGGIEGYYVLHDHLGSVDRLVRAAGSGADTLAFSFDAWGKRRNTDWSADNADARAHDQHWVERGFTGHEHLDAHGLIHMNGRLADPLLGRMLSPDPMMGSTLNPQSFNPYSYTLNNPASYADPSGYLLSGLRKTIKRAIRHASSVGQRIVRRWGRQIVATVAAVYTANVVSSWAYSAQTSAIDIAGPAFLTTDGISAAGTLSAAAGPSTVIGGVAGGAVAGAIGSGNLQGTLVGGLSGGVMGGINVTYGGGYKIGRVLAEATAGGVTAELQGGDFASGFITGGSLSSLTWAALEMRSAMIEQSRRNPANAAGSSAGFRGDGFKLGGCRRPCLSSPLGGAQGGPGIFLGAHYSPDSFLDRLVETYSGPHDFLNSPIFYNEFGDNIVRPDFFHVFNAANVLLATPFAAASVVPSYAYGALSD